MYLDDDSNFQRFPSSREAIDCYIVMTIESIIIITIVVIITTGKL